MPGLNKLVTFYANKKVAFISFTYDSTAKVMEFLKQNPFNFQIVANNDEVRRNNFKLFSAWPYTIIIGKEGKIMFMKAGSEGTEAFSYFNKIIDKLL